MDLRKKVECISQWENLRVTLQIFFNNGVLLRDTTCPSFSLCNSLSLSF